MKNFINYILLSLCLLFLASCKEVTPELEVLPALVPVNNDVDGGNWKTVLNYDYLEAINLSAPHAVESDTYLSELDELITVTNSRTTQQEKIIDYWSAGSVLRWNQIARDLVSKYNVAPPVGKAPDPQKPFANPPFAVRAYALLSAAQHDALIVAWHYKYQYNRMAPKTYANEINAYLSDTGLPSYPSEQAVIATVSAEILGTLFPLEKEFLSQRAEEHIKSTQWAGLGISNDINGGLEIAEVVAEQYKSYADKDRMSEANDPNDEHLVYFDIANQVAVPWKCIESPLRKPMLPFYSVVKTWYDSASVYAATPPPPPAIGSAEFETDIKNVRQISDNRTREQWRISDFWADGGGTSTPPGHWNRIAEGLILNARMSELRTARVFSLMNRAMMDAGILSWWSKYKYYLPRPSQIDPEITIATGIPNFPSYVSGHSTFSASAGTVLGHLFPQEKASLIQMYEEAGISRVYGGIHYNCDNIAGRVAGIAVGQLAIEWANNDNAN